MIRISRTTLTLALAIAIALPDLPYGVTGLPYPGPPRLAGSVREDSSFMRSTRTQRFIRIVPGAIA